MVFDPKIRAISVSGLSFSVSLSTHFGFFSISKLKRHTINDTGSMNVYSLKNTVLYYFTVVISCVFFISFYFCIKVCTKHVAILPPTRVGKSNIPII